MSQPAAAPSLAEQYRQTRGDKPTLRARDLAETLGISEGALAEVRTELGEATRLTLRGGDCQQLLSDLKGVGPVMTLCRNAAAVHETTGTVEEVAGTETMGQVVGPIDLRCFFREWHVAYEIAEETRSGLRRSFQIFDPTGTAVLKVYGVGGTDWTAWSGIVERHRNGAPAASDFQPAAVPDPDRPDSEIDSAALRQDWLALEHSHEFHRLMRTHGVSRLQALRLAGEDLARPCDDAVTDRILRGAAAEGVPIMCFVGNRGCIQIYSGPVQTIEPRGPWLNVLDPAFNLHLRTDLVASAWRVVKPTTARGQITSLELYAADGTLILQLFGHRSPGEGERPAWRAVIDSCTGET